jgi:hypothetical protein
MPGDWVAEQRRKVKSPPNQSMPDDRSLSMRIYVYFESDKREMALYIHGARLDSAPRYS